MNISILSHKFSVCKVKDYSQIDLESEFVFISKTDEEKSLLCPTYDVPTNTTNREDGWRGMRIEGNLDFSLLGIISKITETLAANGIPVFVISTFNTDYIFVKENNLDKAKKCLIDAGHNVR